MVIRYVRYPDMQVSADKVSSFGIYEYNPKFDHREQTAHLIAQMIWYFMEGYNLRIDEYPFESKKNYKKYIVLVEDETINFYKSDKSERWWMEVDFTIIIWRNLR